MVGSGSGPTTRHSGRSRRGRRPGLPGIGGTPTAAARIAALATTLLGTRIPLAVGRTARTATPAQRRALAARDRGCIIPGCAIPAEACQTHHVARLGRRREHRPTESGPALLGTSPPGRPRHVDHRPHHRRRPGPPTRTRRPTRNPLARQPQRTLDHHPHPPNPLAAVRCRARSSGLSQRRETRIIQACLASPPEISSRMP